MTDDSVGIGRCFACGKALGDAPKMVGTRDARTAYVGRDCLALVRAAGEDGYQPPRGGPRLRPLPTTYTDDLGTTWWNIADELHRGPCYLSMQLDARRGDPATCICETRAGRDRVIATPRSSANSHAERVDVK